MEELIKRFQGFGTVTGREVLEARGVLSISQKQQLRQLPQNSILNAGILTGRTGFIQPQRVGVTDTINLNIDIEGTNFLRSGTPEEIRESVANLSPQIISVIERALAFKLQNEPQSPISKGTSTAIRRE